MEEDAFEQSADEVLYYNYSEQIPSPKLKKKVNRETPPRLELLKAEPFLAPSFKKGVYEATKVLRIGAVTFRSNFESGNLGSAEQSGLNSFTITMEKESNSHRPSSWFYFSVEGIKGQATFNIEGFTKSSSLYNEGMKVCYRDLKEGKWRRGGARIAYGSNQNDSYSLRFAYFFKTNECSKVEFAYCFPYPFRQLMQVIEQLPFVQLSSLGKSKDGRDIPLLTVGAADKPIIVLSARVHPGESVASFLMEGFLRQLLGGSQFGSALLHEYQLKIVPMLNPDGVIRGNYRFSAVGQDLNRKWLKCKEAMHPQIYYLKDLLQRERQRVVLFMDLHGHSRRKDVFFYGCGEGAAARELPFFMGRVDPAFNYERCCFAVQREKEGTARVAMWRDLRIPHVYTLQASFCGLSTSPNNFLEADYHRVGRKLCEGIAAFFCTQATTKQLAKAQMLKQQARQQLESSPYLLNVGVQDCSGSESEPQLGEGLQPKLATNSLKLANATISHPPASHHNQPSTQHPAKTAMNKGSKGIEERLKGERLFTDEVGSAYVRVHPEVKLSNVVKYEGLNSSSLHQRNIRVHSMTRTSARLKGVLDPYENEEHCERDILPHRMDMTHTKEWAQYRRVRLISEAKAAPIIQTSKSIAPRFYPTSQQRSRRATLQRNKISIHGDDFDVKCQGIAFL